MRSGKDQNGALAVGHAQPVDLPLQGGAVHLRGGAFGGGTHGDNPEAGGDLFGDDNVRGAGLGDVCRQIRENPFQLGVVRGDGQIGRVRIRGPFLQGVLVEAAVSGQADDVDGDALGLCLGGNGGGGAAGGGDTVGEHDHDPGIGRGRIEQLQRFGKRVGVVGGAVGGEAVDGGFQRLHRGDELGVLGGGGGKADNADTASAADLAVLGTVGCLVQNVQECSGAGFQAFQGVAGHAPGAVQDQHDIRGIRLNVRLRREGQGDLKGAAAVNTGVAEFFGCVGNAHNAFFLSGPDWPVPEYAGNRQWAPGIWK